jgi:hypothetical protein
MNLRRVLRFGRFGIGRVDWAVEPYLFDRVMRRIFGRLIHLEGQAGMMKEALLEECV